MIVCKGYIHIINYVAGSCPDCGDIMARNIGGTLTKQHKCKGNYTLACQTKRQEMWGL